ncbi:hypothetical protein ACG7TL_007908 [Trametes sanguinea]
MSHIALVDFDTFERDVLGVGPCHLEDVAALPEKLVKGAKFTFKKVLHGDDSLVEDYIAKQFIAVVKSNTHGRVLQNHDMLFTGNRVSELGYKSMVNAGLYPRQHAPAAGQVNWPHIRLLIEFKRADCRLDPFDDSDPRDPEAGTQSGEMVRDQLLDYARVVHEYQHRTCIYSLLVIGPEFRLMRYDNSGIIVTKKQNYAENPRPLLSFLAWFDCLSDEHQGLDPTAILLQKGSKAYALMDEFAKESESDMSHNEGDQFDATPQYDTPTVPLRPDGPARNTRQQTKAAAAISQIDESYLDGVELVDEDPRIFKYVRDKFRESLNHGWPRYKLEVGQGEGKRIFLVGKPVWTAFWLFGRGTRGYVALDVKTRRFTFLKDCWRPFYEGVDPEGRYLELLNKEATKDRRISVPTVIAHGDVADQVTSTASYVRRCAEFSGIGEDQMEYRVYRHYRIVFKDVCLPFTAIRSSRQLVRGLYHCIMTHSAAYETFRLLHRDISAGNVLMLPTLSTKVNENGKRTVTWTGILTDWELAIFVPESDESGKRPEISRHLRRTGTWQFMSVAHIRNHTHQLVSVADELESFFHVFLFYAARLLRHNIPDVRSFVSEYFHRFTLAPGGRRDSSLLKSITMQTGSLQVDRGRPLEFIFICDSSVDQGLKVEVVHHHLNRLFTLMLRYFKARYAIQRWEVWCARNNGVSQPFSITPPSVSPTSDDEDVALRGTVDSDIMEDDSEDMTDEPSFKPSDQDRKVAKMLQGHLRILNDFWKALGHAGWPKNDVVEDRLPETYDPMELILTLTGMCTPSAMRTTEGDDNGAPSRKRRRAEASESGPSGKGKGKRRCKT